MPTPRVAAPFDEREHGRPRLGVRRPPRAGEQLAIERREEALGQRVPGPVHRPSVRSPASRPACATWFRIAWPTAPDPKVFRRAVTLKFSSLQFNS